MEACCVRAHYTGCQSQAFCILIEQLTLSLWCPVKTSPLTLQHPRAYTVQNVCLSRVKMGFILRD